MTQGAAFSEAAGLVVGLSQNPKTTARTGVRWAYAPFADEFSLAVDGQTLSDRDRGLCGHESSHERITRYQWFAPWPELDYPVFADLMNSLEDPRVNRWTLEAYAGAQAWMEAVWAGDRRSPAVQSNSLFTQFSMVASAEDAFGWKPPGGWPLAGEVLGALRRTRDVRRRYAEVELPTPRLAAELERDGLAAALDREVTPLIHRALPFRPTADRMEAVKLVSAARGYRLIREHVLPEVVRLVEIDLQRLGGRAKDAAFAAQLESLDDGELADLVERGLAGIAVGAPGAAGEAVRAAYARYVAGRLAARGRGRGADVAMLGEDFGRSVGRSRRTLPTSRRKTGRRPDMRSKIHPLLEAQLPALQRRLEQAFRLAPRLRLRNGHPVGVAPDLPAVMRFEVDRKGYDRLWRNVESDETDRAAAVFLLVDNSGSMSGAEIEAAILGATLLAQAIRRIGANIRLAIYGFQNVIYPFKTFGEPASGAAIDRIQDMTLEVKGERAGGNNHPENNFDGECVAAACAILRRQPCAQKVLVVVSDGEPSSGNEGEQALHAAVAAARHQGLHVIGLGLGQATRHVERYYKPHFVAEIPTGQFATAIGDVVLKALRRPKSQRPT